MASSGERENFASWPLTLGIPAVLMVVLAGAWWWNRPNSDTAPDQPVAVPRKVIVGKAVKPEPRPEGYVGSEACAKCHASVAETYASHPMYRSAGRTPGHDDLENFETGTEFTVDDGRTYRVTKEDGGIYHHELLLDKQGEVIYKESAKIDFFIGSGTRGKSYAIDRDGLLFQSPISWFTSEHKWDLSPGYAHRHARFGRRIQDQCVLCHAGRPTSDPDRESCFPEPVLVEAAIGCERCHGPGQRHIEFHDSAKEANSHDPIVNPAKLAPDRREAVCYQCHLIGKMRFPRYGRTFDDFRPGDRLDDVWATMVAGTGVRGDRKTKPVSHVEQMRDSKCFNSSEGRMGCVSCHSAHSVPAHDEVAAYYRQRCVECHAQKGCSLPEEKQAAPPANNSCIHCHMPRLSAHDIAHASQTDHRILREAEEENEMRYGAESRDINVFDRQHSTMPDWEMQRALALAKVRGMQEAGYANPAAALDLQQTLEAITRIAPDDFATWSALGAAYELRQDLPSALQAWKRSLALRPSNEIVLDALANTHRKTGENQQALEYMDRLLKINPWRSRDYMQRAMVLSDLGRWPEAIRDAEKSLEIDPLDKYARRWLINAYQQTGDIEASRRHSDLLKRISER
jgi:predicted CXXCH cytochrome family protein